MDIVFMPESAIVYQYNEMEQGVAPCELIISIEPADCLYVARKIVNNSQSVCVLNMANQYYVGGDYLNYSCGAQEESLIKRTNLLESLRVLDGVVKGNVANPYRYKLPNTIGFEPFNQFQDFGEFTCLFSTNIIVTKLDSNEAELCEPFEINVISSAAYNLTEVGELLSENRYVVGTLLKIVNQLRTAKKHGVRHLVLGAFGCGAFQNDPQLIAELYHAAIYEYEFQGCFDSITFAILSSPENRNYSAFKWQFEQKSVQSVYEIIKRLLISPYETDIEYYITPFSQIRSDEQMCYTLNRLIDNELHSVLKCNSQQEQAKYLFLQQLKHLISEYPAYACVVLDVWFHSERWKSMFSFATSRLKVHSQFDLKLADLFSKINPLLPSLNHALTDRMKSLSKKILDHVHYLISQFSSDEEKKVMCYLIYLSIKKESKTLERELLTRFKKKNNNTFIIWLREINNICQRETNTLLSHIVPEGSDLTEMLRKAVADYVTALIGFFLKTQYSLYFDESLFEKAIKANEAQRDEYLSWKSFFSLSNAKQADADCDYSNSKNTFPN